MHTAKQLKNEHGFVFYTNFESAKGREILGSMKAAMCFHWKSLRLNPSRKFLVPDSDAVRKLD